MKQFGNLAMVCAKRENVYMTICSGYATVHIGHGPGHETYNAHWSDDKRIIEIIHRINFGTMPRSDYEAA